MHEGVKQKDTQKYKGLLEQFEIIYNDAYDEGWNDALEAVKKITPKTISNEKEEE